MRFLRLLVLAVLSVSLTSCTRARSTSSRARPATTASRAAGATPATSSSSSVEPPAPGEPAPVTDPCLIGAWRLTPENAIAFYRRILGRANAPITVTAVTGGSTMLFNADGTTELALADLRVTYQVTTGATVTVTISIAGTGSAHYAARDGMVTYSESSSDFRGSARMTVDGQETEMPWDSRMGEAFGGAIRGELRYTCTPESLVATPMNVEGAAPVTWVR